MPKKRKPATPARKAATGQKKTKRAKPAPSLRVPRSKKTNDEFFIPASMLATGPSEQDTASVDDEEFFIPEGFGRPVFCAWCETEHAPGPENCPRNEDVPPEWEQVGEGIDFRKLGQMRWTDGDMSLGDRTTLQRQQGDRDRVVFAPEYDARGNCKYGCGGFASTVVSGIGMHHYSCQYWNNEGKDKTPF